MGWKRVAVPGQSRQRKGSENGPEEVAGTGDTDGLGEGAIKSSLCKALVNSGWVLGAR